MIFFEVGETYICGHLCVTSLLFCICSPNPGVLFSDVGVSCCMSPTAIDLKEGLVARLGPDQSFLSLCHGRRVALLSMLYNVNSNSNH